MIVEQVVSEFTSELTPTSFQIEHSVFAPYQVEEMPQRTQLLETGFNVDIGLCKLDRVCQEDEADVIVFL